MKQKQNLKKEKERILWELREARDSVKYLETAIEKLEIDRMIVEDKINEETHYTSKSNGRSPRKDKRSSLTGSRYSKQETRSTPHRHLCPPRAFKAPRRPSQSQVRSRR